MKRFTSICAVVLGLGAGLVVATPAEAGTGEGIVVSYQVSGGGDPDAVGSALVPELFLAPDTIGGSGTLVAGCSPSGVGASRACTYVPGNLTPGENYIIGVDGLDDAYEVNGVSCFNSGGQQPVEMLDTSEFPNALIPYDQSDQWDCTVSIVAKPMLYIDKVVNGGTLGASDFTLEIYDDTGAIVPIAPAIIDPADAQCSFAPIVRGLQASAAALTDETTCAAIPLSAGEYTIGEILPDYGYDEASLFCVSAFDFSNDEILSSPTFDFTHSNTDRDDTLCTLTNDYLTQTVSADIEVTNDNGRTATGADFAIEVFNSSGVLVASGVDPEPGAGNASAEFVLPIGDYTFGVAGPEGYVASATVTASATTAGSEVIGTGAGFTLARDLTAIGVISVNDLTVPTTTTTTTTTTTIAAVPITLTGVLPATGSSSQTPLMLLAFGLMLFGGGAVLATRRR